MKKYGIWHKITAIAMVCLLCALTVVPVFAESLFSDAKEPVDIHKKCSLTLTAKSANKVYADRAVKLFCVATPDEAFVFTPTKAFAGYAIELNKIASQAEWSALTETLSAYIIADKIAPTSEKTTGQDGVVSFTELPVGLYYVKVDSTVIAPFVVTLPTLGTDGALVYDSVIYPKSDGDEPDPTEPSEPTEPTAKPTEPTAKPTEPTAKPTEPTTKPTEPTAKPTEPAKQTYQILVEWQKDDPAYRPDAVYMDIYCDGKLVDQVVITADTNWQYSWEADGEHEWSVVQRNASDEYETLIEQRGTQFVITNTLCEVPTKPTEPAKPTYQILVEWRDNDPSHRPGTVYADIYCDGELFDQAVITADTNWLYTWEMDGEHKWTVVQRNVSDLYVTVIEQRGMQFVITNTLRVVPPEDAPDTGDVFQAQWSIVVMAVAGVACLLFGFRRKEQTDE